MVDIITFTVEGCWWSIVVAAFVYFTLSGSEYDLVLVDVLGW